MSNQKSLDEILKRNDYVKLVPKLKERAERVAKMIREKMDELDQSEISIKVDGGFYTVFISTVKSRSINCSSDYLAILKKDEYGDARTCSLEDINRSYYYCNDYNAMVMGADSSNALFFLNHAADLIRALDKIEDRLVNEMEFALDNTPKIQRYGNRK